MCLGLSKGVGFVRFDLRHEAERSIKQLNGLIPDGSGEPITVKFANSPSSSRHNNNNNMNNNHFPLSSASMAAYLSPTRRLMGSLHHPANRFRCVGFSYLPSRRPKEKTDSKLENINNKKLSYRRGTARHAMSV